MTVILPKMDLIWPDIAYISLQILSIIKEYYNGPARQFNKTLKLFQTYKSSKNSPNMAYYGQNIVQNI